MDLSPLLAFALVAIAVTLVPGPNFLLLVRTVANAGLAAGFGNIGGFATAYLLHGMLCAFGLSSVVAASPFALGTIELLGGAYLLVTGVRTLCGSLLGGSEPNLATLEATDRGTSSRARRVALAAADGFATSLLNPKTALFYLAAFPAFVGKSGTAAETLSLVGVHLLTAVSWFSFVALSFARLTGLLSSPRFSNAIAAASGATFVALGMGVVAS